MSSFQICLCRKRACGTFTEKGLCTTCSYCHFFCTEEDEFIYDQAVKRFLATKQPQPLCCMDVIRTKAKMKTITDPKDTDFGRPYFVCSKKANPCMYFEWGDEAIVPRPLCEHGKPCRKKKEWKKESNKVRYTFSCGEPSSYISGRGRCNFFMRMDVEDEIDDKDTSTEFLRLNDEFPHYTDEFMLLMKERRVVGLTNIHEEYMNMIGTKELLEKRL